MENYLDFNIIVFCSPSLSQQEYKVIIKWLQCELNINQIRTLFEVQKDNNIDLAFDTMFKLGDQRSFTFVIYNHYYWYSKWVGSGLLDLVVYA